jgi:hypothetical protein
MLSLVVGVLASGCQTAPAAAPAGPEPSVLQPAPPPPNASHIPAGTVLVGTLTDDLSKRETKVGDAFTVAVQNALVAENHETVVPAGAVITGLVTGIGSKGEQSAIRLNFTRVGIDGASHPFTATITATRVPEDRRSADDSSFGPAAGGSAGAALGEVIGEGELRSALVGALGAGAGTIIGLGTGADEELPTGTQITLQTVERIELETR